MRSQTKIKRDACMKFCDVACSCTRIMTELVLVLKADFYKDSMNCGHSEIPDNAVLQLNIFSSKSLYSAEQHCRKNRMWDSQNSTWCRKVPPLLLPASWGKYASSMIISCWWQYPAKMWPHCLSGGSTLCYKCTSTGCTSHISLAQTYTLQAGCLAKPPIKEDQEIAGILVCTTIEDIQAATCEDAHLEELKAYIIQGWPHNKEDVEHKVR